MENAIRPDRTQGAGKVIPARRVRLTEPPAASLSDPDLDLQEPQVTLVKDGNTVKAIIIACSCGKKTRLECEY